MNTAAANDYSYSRLETERRKCSEKQITLLRQADGISTDIPHGYEAACSGLERRGLARTYRVEAPGYRSYMSRKRYVKGSRRTYWLTELGKHLAEHLPPKLQELRPVERDPMDAYHTTTDHGERVVVICPGGETDPLHPDDAEKWGLEILAAVNRARDVENDR